MYPNETAEHIFRNDVCCTFRTAISSSMLPAGLQMERDKQKPGEASADPTHTHVPRSLLRLLPPLPVILSFIHLLFPLPIALWPPRSFKRSRRRRVGRAAVGPHYHMARSKPAVCGVCTPGAADRRGVPRGAPADGRLGSPPHCSAITVPIHAPRSFRRGTAAGLRRVERVALVNCALLFNIAPKKR